MRKSLMMSKKNKKILVRKEDFRKAIFDLIAELFQHRNIKELIWRKYRNPGLYVWHIDDHDKLKPFHTIISTQLY